MTSYRLQTFMVWINKLKRDVRGHRMGGGHSDQHEVRHEDGHGDDSDLSLQSEIEEEDKTRGGRQEVTTAKVGASSASSSSSMTDTKPEQSSKSLSVLMTKSISKPHFYGNIMQLIRRLCHEIVKEYPTGHTESFYEKVLAQYLYERSIPCITQVDCFIQRPFSQVMVGRIDMEVAHTVLLELKVAPRIKQADMDQLWKYIRAKKACGMQIEHAAVICFCTSSTGAAAQNHHLYHDELHEDHDKSLDEEAKLEPVLSSSSIGVGSSTNNTSTSSSSSNAQGGGSFADQSSLRTKQKRSYPPPPPLVEIREANLN